MTFIKPYKILIRLMSSLRTKFRLGHKTRTLVDFLPSTSALSGLQVALASKSLGLGLP